MNKIIWLLLLVSLLKEIIFSAVVPMWHTPDEQAHFAQVAYFAEFGKMPKYPPDLNREIWESEKLLGTDRDKNGNNKFTFHPEYRIEYTNGLIGKYEQEIINFPISYRSELIRQEAANYPPLYYWVGGLIYKTFYQADLITRVFAVRLFSIFCGVLTVYVAWLIAKQLFPKNFLYQITLPLLVSFQPMFSFVSAGVTSDNLLNLLFTVVVYLCLILIEKGFKLRILIGLLIIFLLTYLTKPQFMLSLPIIILAIVFRFTLNPGTRKVVKLLISLGVLLLLGGIVLMVVNTELYLSIEKFYPQSFSPLYGKIADISFWQFFRETITHTIAEVIPWYWGVFDWLGVTFPREVHRVINRLLIFAALGVIVKFILIARKRTREDWLFIFMLLCAAIYFGGITYYNYLFTLSHGFPFGIQGRYYFPTIVSQMLILMIGLEALVPAKFSLLKIRVIKLLSLSMIALNFIALWVIAGSYYDLSSLNNFIIQTSQYKPFFNKGLWLWLWFIVYLGALSSLIFTYLKIKQTQPKTGNDI